MSDHGAGPRSIANPEVDITDVFAFPSPERPGHLVMVMNTYPFKEIEATRLFFSDALDYRIRVRGVRVASTGPSAAFEVGEEERAFSFIFDVPQKSGDSLLQSGICHGPSGKISVRVGDVGSLVLGVGGAPVAGDELYAAAKEVEIIQAASTPSTAPLVTAVTCTSDHPRQSGSICSTETYPPREASNRLIWSARSL
jgi:hypothetical protein